MLLFIYNNQLIACVMLLFILVLPIFSVELLILPIGIINACLWVSFLWLTNLYHVNFRRVPSINLISYVIMAELSYMSVYSLAYRRDIRVLYDERIKANSNLCYCFDGINLFSNETKNQMRNCFKLHLFDYFTACCLQPSVFSVC